MRCFNGLTNALTTFALSCGILFLDTQQYHLDFFAAVWTWNTEPHLTQGVCFLNLQVFLMIIHQ